MVNGQSSIVRLFTMDYPTMDYPTMDYPTMDYPTIDYLTMDYQLAVFYFYGMQLDQRLQKLFQVKYTQLAGRIA
jgi:hypothetical protein